MKPDDDGVIRIGGTRVTLDTLIAVFWAGATPEEIVQRYSALQVADVYQVIGYYLRHAGEVDAYLCRRRAEADTVRQHPGKKSSVVAMQARLLARRSTGAP